MEHFKDQLNPAIVSKAHSLEQLTTTLNGILPPETCRHYHVTGFNNSTLVIITDSPVWTTRLRQLGPSIIAALSDIIGEKLQHVRIVTRHGSIKAPVQSSPMIERELSKASGKQLAQTAEYVKDEALKEALLKFSQRGRKKD
ncbi:MAG: DUF721 domain-containing protein [Gammaproteobacteria bacterium]|nr:DUF721 domain-containing protein [Gammaproteobacteria bacterium]MCW8922486.1 DUF721 domain-containing protein [Gammaproteobacteria bacterium]